MKKNFIILFLFFNITLYATFASNEEITSLKNIQKNLNIKLLNSYKEKREILYFKELQTLINSGHASSYIPQNSNNCDFYSTAINENSFNEIVKKFKLEYFAKKNRSNTIPYIMICGINSEVSFEDAKSIAIKSFEVSHKENSNIFSQVNSNRKFTYNGVAIADDGTAAFVYIGYFSNQ
ncbi:hypothetical protein [Fusobacterium sp. PH5-44]|uniref:hypothetical protein n=1 Tax=unclassified Fusobacterium TaxID=2648384 RepID=UPI003D25457D